MFFFRVCALVLGLLGGSCFGMELAKKRYPDLFDNVGYDGNVTVAKIINDKSNYFIIQGFLHDKSNLYYLALHAMDYRSKRCMRYFIEYLALDLNYGDQNPKCEKEFYTPVVHAAITFNVDMLELFYELKRVEVNWAVTWNGKNLYELAEEKRCWNVCKFFTQKKLFKVRN